MRLPRFKKKYLAIAAAVGVTMGAAGIAMAYFSTTGSGTGTAKVGSVAHWSVTKTGLEYQTTIAPGATNVTLFASIYNPNTHAGLRLHTITVTLPATSNATCKVTWFKLGDAPPWVISSTGRTATRSISSLTIPPKEYYTGNTSSSPTGVASTTGNNANALYHLKLNFATTPNVTQDSCGAVTVHVHVT